jgi:putative methionine-R-sulfoxide reductase with GAF domain/streptogramin lyase
VVKKLCRISCIALLLLQQAAAQTGAYHVQVISHNDLRGSGEILQLMKDDKGYLWLLFPTKVQRYDGKQLFSFPFDDRCVSIQQDANGTIWLACRSVVYRYKNDYTGFEKLTASAGDSVQHLALLAGPGRNIYLLTRQKILQWNNSTQRFESLPVALFVTSFSFSFLKSKGNYLFYKKSEKALARYHVITGAEDTLAVKSGNFVFPVNEDTVWVRPGIGGSVLASFSNKTIQSITGGQFAERFNDNRFFVTGSSDFSFICFNDKGYYNYDVVSGRFSKIKLLYNGLPLGGSPPIYSFYKEEDGNVWFANEEGLVHFNPGKNTIGLIRSNAAAGENWNNNVRSIAEDEEGNLWFATANGFCRQDNKTGIIKTWLPKSEADNYLNFPSVRSIGTSNGKVVIGQSEKGFWIFNPKTEVFTRPVFENDSIQKQFRDGFNSNMMKLRNGNFLILSRRVWLMDKGDFSVGEVKFNGFNPVPRNAYEDAQGRIWFAGSGGIFCTDSLFKLLYSTSTNEINRWANAVVQLDENTFWIAAKNLYEIKLLANGKMEWRPLFPELKAVHISHLYRDEVGSIWMFAENGIYRYLPDKKVLEKFDRRDNAQSYNVAVSNSFRSRDGTVYAGSTNGINYFKAGKVPFQNDSLQVQVTNIIVNGDDSTFLLNQSLTRLAYRQNSLVFEFVAPYIYHGEKIQYRCRLQGADKEWIYIGNANTLRYTSLKPGDYSFHCAASLNGKDWYGVKTPFVFSIAPPFWQTGWFRLPVLLLTVLSIYAFTSWRAKQIEKRAAYKTEVERLKSVNLQNQLEIEQVVNYFATSIGSRSTIDDMLWDVAKNCISKLGFEDCVIYLKDKERNVLLQKAAWGPKTNEQNKIISPIEIPFGKGIVGAVAVSGKAEIIADTTFDKRYIVDDASRLSEITVPILLTDKVIGVIDSEHSKKNFYTKQHLHILATVAAMLSDNIEKIQAGQLAREKEIEVLKLNKDISDWQVAALRAQMNPHFIFNAMNSIQQFTLKNDIDSANLYLSKFSILLRKVLHFSEQNYLSLEEEMEQLKLYLDIEALRMGDGFSYSIRAGSEIETDAVKIPGMLVQPFVENALKHGLAMKEGDKKLQIEFYFIAENMLAATITDNGIGRRKAQQLKKQQEKLLPHKAKGIQLVEERLRLLNQVSTAEKPIIIKDMVDDSGHALGTRVDIVLPVLQG